MRAKAIALRHIRLVDNFCDAARDLGLNPGVQSERWISLEIKGNHVAVIPAVGRPSADRINEIYNAVLKYAKNDSKLWIIYDSQGLQVEWVRHLNWLDSHLPIRTFPINSISAILKEETS